MDFYRKKSEFLIRMKEQKVMKRIRRDVGWKCTGRECGDEVVFQINRFCCDFIRRYEKMSESIGVDGALLIEASESRNHKQFWKFLKAPFINKVFKLKLFFTCSFGNRYRRFHRHVMKFIPNVTKSFELYGCNISHNQFRKIVQIGKHISNFSFRRCRIFLTKLKFSDNLHYCIKTLTFTIESCAYLQTSEHIIESLEGLLKAIQPTDMKSSLIEMKIDIEEIRRKICQFAGDIGLSCLNFPNHQAEFLPYI
ncbi:unnamed protein product [Moneuplotes crassus]|uniref:Uncharacterized protein n=1 Tax=Euplotes crassus TaxID=5936 RepID=A0AAD2D2T4_EUPCR|nr:unnamed protein product [Moneuplotes crassus]